MAQKTAQLTDAQAAVAQLQAGGRAADEAMALVRIQCTQQQDQSLDLQQAVFRCARITIRTFTISDTMHIRTHKSFINQAKAAHASSRCNGFVGALSCSLRQQAAEEAQRRSEAEAESESLRRQLQQQRAAAADAARRAENAAADSAAAQAALLQQLQQAFEQQRRSKVCIARSQCCIIWIHSSLPTGQNQDKFEWPAQPDRQHSPTPCHLRRACQSSTQSNPPMQEDSAVLHEHAAGLHGRIDDLSAENDHLAARAAVGDAAVDRLQVAHFLLDDLTAGPDRLQVCPKAVQML